MIEEAKRPEAPFREILVWKFSRFTRKREHAVAFKSMLRRRGIRVVSITEHADDTPTGKLMEAIIESVDEFYSENLALEVIRGMRESASRGFWMNARPPFGYRKVYVQDGAKKRPRLELDKEQAPVVRRMFDMALEGKSSLDITKALNRDGIPSPKGKRWHKNTVHKILKNESYTGTLVWGTNSRGRRASGTREQGLSCPRHQAKFPPGGGPASLPVPKDRTSKEVLQPLPAQRPGKVRELSQGPHGLGGQERQVHLLRLPLPADAGPAHLQDPKTQLRSTSRG